MLNTPLPYSEILICLRFAGRSSRSSNPPVVYLKVPIKALDTAPEVVEVDVLEDDAIFDLRPEGPSRLAISVMD